MRNYLRALAIGAVLAIISGIVDAQVSPNIGLSLPPIGQLNWGVAVNGNFSLLDLYLSGNAGIPGIRFATTGAQPLCDANFRGNLFIVQGNGTTTTDSVQVCTLQSSGSYTWTALGGSAQAVSFNEILSGTNTAGALIVSSGSSLFATGSGTITATSMPVSGLTGSINATLLNGTSVPASQACVGTNSSSQIISSTCLSSISASYPLSSSSGATPNISLGYVPTPVVDPTLIGQRSTEVGGRPTFVFLGDSYTQGTGCSTFVQCFVPIFSAAVQTQFGARSVSGIVMANAGTGPEPSQEGTMNFAGAWAPDTIIGPSSTRPDSAVSYSAQAGSASATVSYACPTAASFNIWYGTFTDTAAGWTARLDGGSPATYGNTTTGSATWAVQNISTGSVGSHVIQLIAPTSGNFHFFGLECLSGSVPGVIVENLGVAGAVSSSIGGSPATQLGMLPLLPGASTKQLQTAIMIGTNDSFFGVSVATYQAQMLATATFALQYGPVVIVSQPLVSRSDMTLYNAAALAVAKTLGIPYLSISDYWGSIANETALGLLNGDNVHPSNIGHGLIADQLYNRLVSPFLGSPNVSLLARLRLQSTSPTLTVVDTTVNNSGGFVSHVSTTAGQESVVLALNRAPNNGVYGNGLLTAAEFACSNNTIASNISSYCRWFTEAGAPPIIEHMRLTQGLAVGSANVGTDPGEGSISAANQIVIGAPACNAAFAFCIGSGAQFKTRVSGYVDQFVPVQDTTITNSLGYFFHYSPNTSESAGLALNRNPVTGAFNNTGRTAGAILVTSLGTGPAYIRFQTGQTPNVAPIDVATVRQGLSVGTTAATSDPGLGNVAVDNQIAIGNTGCSSTYLFCAGATAQYKMNTFGVVFQDTQIQDPTTLNSLGYFFHYSPNTGESTGFSLNRNPLTGIFVNTGRTAGAVEVSSVGAGPSYVRFFTGQTVNVAPVEAANIQQGLSIGPTAISTDAGLGNILMDGITTELGWKPVSLYAASGNPLPTCASRIRGEDLSVGDATAPTYMGAYASGGQITTRVICSFNGTTYSWLTH